MAVSSPTVVWGNVDGQKSRGSHSSSMPAKLCFAVNRAASTVSISGARVQLQV